MQSLFFGGAMAPQGCSSLGLVPYFILHVLLCLPFEWFYVVSKRNSCRFLLLLLSCRSSFLFCGGVMRCDVMVWDRSETRS